jgi:16S rRNA (cytosine1402-N4)-methyltransferase
MREKNGTSSDGEPAIGSGHHTPVLLQQVIETLALDRGLVFVDSTVGSAGHFSAVVRRIMPGGSAIGIDRDESALERAKSRLEAEGLMGEGIFLVHASFAELERVVRSKGFGKVDRLLLDLGLSSDQIDDPGRGFSFRFDGPLDMRQDRRSTLTAAEVVNTYSEAELARVIADYGEERYARRIAAAICMKRKEAAIDSTLKLSEIVASVMPRGEGKTHPATRTFQALRIEVGGELRQLEQGLPQAAELLSLGGLMVIISFHSLEDKVIKKTLRPYGRHAKEDALERGWMVTQLGAVVYPEHKEVKENPRARTARLRVFQKTSVA